MSTRHINPEGLHRSPAFSQAVVVEQPAKTIYIGGQNGVDADGKVVGPTRRGAGRQAFRNLATILESEGASLANIVHWTIAVGGRPQSFDEGVAAFQQVWNPADPPPAITVHVVAGLAPRRSSSRSTPSPSCDAPGAGRSRARTFPPGAGGV